MTRGNYLASPPLVVAYALAGNVNIDFEKDPIGHDQEGKPVMLKDIWPTRAEVQKVVASSVTPELFKEFYSQTLTRNERWNKLEAPEGNLFAWTEDSTYIHLPPFFTGMTKEVPTTVAEVKDAHCLALFGDSITTDHISPAGNIAKSSSAAAWLKSRGVEPKDFNSYGARRGNHEVMMRGTFGNIRIRNEMAPGTEGGVTTLFPDNKVISVYEAAMEYKKRGNDLVVIAGKEYGTGSSRDWAAKGTKLLGVKAVIAESFERIHRSNLVGMGILPFQFKEGFDRKKMNIKGSELFSFTNIEKGVGPRQEVECEIKYVDGTIKKIQLLCRIDTENEVEYYKHGGILQFVLRNMLA